MNYGVYAPNSGRVVNAQLKVLIADITLTNSGSFEAIPIPGGFDSLEILASLRSSEATTADAGRMFFNGDTTEANYRCQYWNATGTTVTTGAIDLAFFGEIPGASSISGYFSTSVTVVLNSTALGKFRGRYSISHIRQDATVGRDQMVGCYWESTEPITSVTIRTDNHATDLFVAGSCVQVFGLGTFAVALAR